MNRNCLKAAVRRAGLASAVALLASTAHAGLIGVILSPGTVTPSYNSPIQLVSSSLTSSQIVNGTVTGPKIFGSAEFSSPQINSLTGYNISITDAGTANGLLTSNSLPVSWDFTLAENLNAGGNSALSWTLTYTVNPARSSCALNLLAACSLSPTFQTSGTGFGEFKGTGAIAGLTGLTATNWSVDLDIQWQPVGTNNSYTLDVTIPNNSIDMPAANAPEPTTTVLMAGGLAALAFLRRFRRK